MATAKGRSLNALNEGQRVHRWLQPVLMILFLSLLMACRGPIPPPTPTSPALADELVFYDWAEDMPKSVLDAFTAEYGVKVTVLTYQSQEEALQNIQAGQTYDVAVIENEYIPALVTANRLAEIDFRNVPNFKNISANFRDLAFDPGNQHSVPYHFGTTGLLVRTDLLPNPPTRWADLWDQRYAGKIAMRTQMRDIIGFTLMSLGYSFNSENPKELEAVRERLLALRPLISFTDVEAASAVPGLVSGEYAILVGWAEDIGLAREQNSAIAYVLPQDAIALWGDNYVIPANSPSQYTAELFINFLLRPEISAQIVNEKYYANANEASYPLIKTEIRNDRVIFPSDAELKKASFYLPLSPEAEQLYVDIWNEFLSGNQ